MKPDWLPGEEHEQFTEWTISQGVIVNGVGPARFPGRGLGMRATRNINVRARVEHILWQEQAKTLQNGEAMVTVPLKAMFTVNCIPSAFIGKFPDGISVHGIFAAFLTHGDPEDLEMFDTWRKTWPSRQDFKDSMPLLWPESVRAAQTNLLPPSISGRWNSIKEQTPIHDYEAPHQNLLAEQENRLKTAWDTVVSVFPETDREMFVYHWCIVNTRCFYFLMPGQEPPEDRNDAMALLPFADYFNHSDVVVCILSNPLC